VTNSSNLHRRAHLRSRALECGMRWSHTAPLPPVPCRRKNTTRVRRQHTEGVRVGTYDKVLIRLVWRLPPLFPSTHEPPTRFDARLDLRQMYLHHHTLLSRLAIPHLGHAISRATDLQEHLALHAGLLWRHLQLTLFHVARCAPREVRLVLFALRVCEVGPFVCV
jgi:hypothetical protein